MEHPASKLILMGKGKWVIANVPYSGYCYGILIFFMILKIIANSDGTFHLSLSLGTSGQNVLGHQITIQVDTAVWCQKYCHQYGCDIQALLSVKKGQKLSITSNNNGGIFNPNHTQLILQAID